MTTENTMNLIAIANSPPPKRNKLTALTGIFNKSSSPGGDKPSIAGTVFRLTALGAAILAGIHGYESLRCYEWFNSIESAIGLAPAVSALMLSTRAAYGLNFWKITKAEAVAAALSIAVSAGWLALFGAGGAVGAHWLNNAGEIAGAFPAAAFFVGLQVMLLAPAFKALLTIADYAGEMALAVIGKRIESPVAPVAFAPPEKASRKSEKEESLRDWLDNNGFEGIEIVSADVGHTLETFELQLPRGKRVAELLKLEKDLSRDLCGQVRIVPVTYGKNTVSLEVPRTSREFCNFSDIAGSDEFKAVVSNGGLPVIVGADKSGNPLVLDLRKMPHLLVAGATGTGKSVGLNAIICGLAMLPPSRVRFLMTDPKFLELNLYNDLPHMIRDCMYELDEVEPVLKKIVEQMNERLRAMAKMRARNIDEYNAKCRAAKQPELPALICIMDEYAEMALEAGKNKESTFQDSVQSLAQKARAAGIHLILSTQKPVVKVLDGVIKANIPARIAFQVSTGKDSEVILDEWGAEQLIGNGDALVKLPDRPDCLRAQGAFISTEQVEKLVQSRSELAV